MVRILFACGHTVMVGSDQKPVCPCGETKRRRVVTRPPHFRGTVSGPYARTENLAPMAVPLAAKE